MEILHSFNHFFSFLRYICNDVLVSWGGVGLFYNRCVVGEKAYFDIWRVGDVTGLLVEVDDEVDGIVVAGEIVARLTVMLFSPRDRPGRLLPVACFAELELLLDQMVLR
ncbi:hypothetical protein TNCV_1046101 [Trichonephila clavipes]|nr:hypothetical protein TNCV_1046101 [Trichonephila clavipes]